MKVFHISDLHFGTQQQTIVDSFLTDLAKIKPEVVIISGDVTQRATQSQYEAFAQFLEKISPLTLIVPGNHDIPLRNVLSRLFYPYNLYKRYVRPSFDAKFQNDEARILGVTSVNPYRIKDGTLSKDTLDNIKDYFSSAFAGLNLLFFHHNFDYLEGCHKPLENYQEFLDYLKGSPVNIVCTGHSHYAHVSVIEKNDSSPCIIIHAGTLLCPRRKDGLNSYYIIDTEENGFKVEWRVFIENSFRTNSTQNFKI